MSIFQLQPDSPAVSNIESVPTALQKPRDSLFTPLFPEAQADSLLKYVEGYPWTCYFYGQLVAQSNSLEHFDPGTPNMTQPVYEIKNMILQVTSPLNPNYDPASGSTTSTGSALVPLGVKPNTGDSFIAQIDTGEDAIFVINSVERTTYRKSAMYIINYSLYAYVSAQPEFVEALNKRTQQTFYFNKDANYFNRDLLLSPSVHHANERLKEFMRESQQYYMQTFSDKVAGTIVLPGVSRTLYDPLLLQFLGRFIDHEVKASHPWFQYTWDNRYLQQKSILDLLMTRNPSMVNVINTDYSFTSTAQLKGPARFGNIFHTTVDYVLYPKNPTTMLDVDTLHFHGPSETFSPIHQNSKAYFESDLTVHSGNNEVGVEKKLLHSLFEQDCYIVSPAFYPFFKSNIEPEAVSFVEVLIARFIRREAIAREDLLKVVESFYSWSPMHQLYLLPVMWLIIRATV